MCFFHFHRFLKLGGGKAELHIGFAAATRKYSCKKMLLKFVNKNIRFLQSSTLYNVANHFF